jgi:hypothetical protein
MLHICLSAAAHGQRTFTNVTMHRWKLTSPSRFWTLGPNWPKGGEIDILEGVNEFTNNGMTLHTSPGCQIGSDTTQFSGSVTTGNCDVAADGQLKNAGCSIAHPSKQSYGAGLNQAGGGVYATAWNSDGISIFFFPRDSVPADALGDNPNPEAWGKPAAKFAGACDIEKMFAEQQIIIDTTFCGAWAGAAWEDGSCAKKAKTCDEYVRDNPEAFTEAYWEINALKVYQDNGKAPAAPSPPAYTPKSTAVSVPVPVSTRSPVAAPPLSSQVAPPNSSVLVPVPVSTKSPVAAPPLSSQVAPPNSSVLVPGVPSKPSVTPIVQIPSSKAPAASGVPSPGPQSSRTRGGPGSARPSKPVNTQINAAPTGAQGMPGWSWPSAGDNGGEDSQVAPPSNGSNTPAENSSGVAALPSSRPSNIPAPPARPSVKPPPVPNVPAEENAAPVRTVYQTVYLTKTAAVGAAATPAPEEKHARMARHIQLHRRRWTQQHAHI